MSVAAIILAGGRSQRMGTPKHAVLLGGRTLLERALDAVGSIPAVVVGPPELAATVSAHPDGSITREQPPFSGPAAAIAAALDELERRDVDAESALILSCDLERPAEAVELLLSTPDTVQDGIALRDADDRIQWLCGLYKVDPLRAAVARLRSTSSLDSARVSALFDGLSITPLADPDGVGRDIDTPADLSAAHRRLAP